MSRIFRWFKKFSASGLILLICLFTFFYKSPFPPYKTIEHDKKSIFSDGFGYYAYLPAVFIYHDLSFSFFEQQHEKNYGSPPPAYVTAFRVNTGTGIVNKYWIGESVLLLPFFIAAHEIAPLAGFEQNGYSPPYQYAVFFAGIFYLFFGCRLLEKYLRKNGFSPTITFLTLITVGLGTNLFYYSLYEPSMSHVYSFFAVAAFCYFTSDYFQDKAFSTFFKAFLFFVLLVLIRPVNCIIILLLPFLAGNLAALKAGLRSLLRFKFKLLLALIPFSLFLLQSYIWHKQCGKWLIYSYPGESFNFSDPHYFDILFSYRKGFFVYMPAMFLGMVGLIPLMKKDLYKAFTSLGFVLFLVYVLSSWYAWDYSACFGNRAFIDFYFVFAVFIAHSFGLFRATFWIPFMGLLYFGLIFFNSIQMYQYRTKIYHYIEMTKERYWTVFLQTGDAYKDVFFNTENNAGDFAILKGNPVFKTHCDFESPDSLWVTNLRVQKRFAFSGHNVSRIEPDIIFGDGCTIKESILPVKENLVLMASLQTYCADINAGASVVVQIMNGNQTVLWQTLRLSPITNAGKKEWKEAVYYCPLPVLKPNDEIRVFMYNPGFGKSAFYIDDFTVRLFENAK